MISAFVVLSEEICEGSRLEPRLLVQRKTDLEHMPLPPLLTSLLLRKIYAEGAFFTFIGRLKLGGVRSPTWRNVLELMFSGPLWRANTVSVTGAQQYLVKQQLVS